MSNGTRSRRPGAPLKFMTAARIFGSGDVFEARDIFRMIEETGVAAVSVARGAIGNPWIFRQAAQIERGESPTPPSGAEFRDVLLEHGRLARALHGEEVAGRLMRKFGIQMSRHHPEAERIRGAFVAVKSYEEWRRLVESVAY